VKGRLNFASMAVDGARLRCSGSASIACTALPCTVTDSTCETSNPGWSRIHNAASMAACVPRQLGHGLKLRASTR
jgi:hypothetical protein